MRRSTRDSLAARAHRQLAGLSPAPVLPDTDPSLPGDVLDPGSRGDGLADVLSRPAVLILPAGRHVHREERSGPLRDWVSDRLPPWLRGRLRLTPAHLVTVTVTVAVSVLLTGWIAYRSAPTVEPAPVVMAGRTNSAPTTEPVLTTDVGHETIVGSQYGGDEAAPTVVVVDVAGRVRHPGVVTLPLGSRVTDAIAKAGGVRKGTDLTSVNLARVLVDGEQILVGKPAAPGVAAAALGQGPSGSPQAPLINLNTAALSELDTLPGVGPVTAQKILDWRTAHGGFAAIDQLLEIDGIGEKTLARLAPLLTL